MLGPLSEVRVSWAFDSRWRTCARPLRHLRSALKPSRAVPSREPHEKPAVDCGGKTCRADTMRTSRCAVSLQRDAASQLSNSGHSAPLRPMRMTTNKSMPVLQNSIPGGDLGGNVLGEALRERVLGVLAVDVLLEAAGQRVMGKRGQEIQMTSSTIRWGRAPISRGASNSHLPP